MTLFKVDDYVHFKNDNLTGQVIEIRDDNVETGPKYLIKFHGNSYKNDWFHESELEAWDREAEIKIAAEIQTKVNEAKCAMEEAWEAYSKAKDLAYKSKGYYHGMSHLVRAGLINIREFESVAKEFGWSSSSLYC